jgi:transcriptional regulator with XRE-family HTH domain
MHLNPHQHRASDTIALRQKAGKWLKERREACGLSQRQLAHAIGSDCYTLISQLESGYGRIPPSKYRLWAAALRMHARDFAFALLPYYDHDIYDVIRPTTESDELSE